MDGTGKLDARRMTGGRALAEMLAAHGAGPMFGMGGFQLLPFYEGCRQLGLRHALINDERCGAFAADAYARVSGRVGLCDGTLGPGATNLVTGLVESLNGGVPVVAVTGNTARAHSWKNMTQECRQADILRPACKDLIRVEDPARIPEHVRRAYAVATSGRAGPVVLDVPEDVAHAECDYAADAFHADPATQSCPARRWRPAAEDVERAAALLSRAERPMMLVGGGVHLSGAWAEVARFANDFGVPVAYTMSGKGVLADAHPLCAGLFGRYSRIANDMMAAGCDALLVVGCKLGEIATKRFALPPAGVPVIHLDILPEEIGRTVQPTVALCGDARDGLRDLLEALADGGRARARRAGLAQEVSDRMAQWRAEAAPRLTSAERPVNMGRMMAELSRVMPADGVLVADGGFAAHWTALLYDAPGGGRTYVADRGLASIGYGLPGALGAQLARPDATVVAVTGDGGLNMTIGEIETARRLGAPFTLVVVNNAASGYVKALQHAMYGQGGYQSSDLMEVDYAAVARAYGCHGIRVEDPDALGEALREAAAERTLPSIVDVVVTRDPGKMLPAADSRTLTVRKGDRPV